MFVAPGKAGFYTQNFSYTYDGKFERQKRTNYIQNRLKLHIELVI